MLDCWSLVVDKAYHLLPGTTNAVIDNAVNAGANPTVGFVMDANCAPIPVQPNAPICGTVGITAIVSPISLLWDDSIDVDDSFTVSEFPLRPGRTKTYYTWKASSRAPLLVYDPEHTGRITSSAQLFGEWTFGGKRTAALGETVQPTHWANGYEPLASMDTDQNGEVSGRELNTLALWFDENRDGVADIGEVKSLAESGVTALYYRFDSQNSLTKNIFASRGYKRIVGEKEVVGRSVDWYGEEATSPAAVGLREQLRSILSSDASVAAPAKPSAQGDLAPPQATSHPLNGAWNWNVSPDGSVQMPGSEQRGQLVFGVSGSALRGLSVVESPAKGRSGTDVHFMAALPLKGTVIKKPDGSQSVSFEVRNPEGRITRSSAELNRSGTLSGKSEVELPETATSTDRRKATYTWTARKAS